MCPASVLYVCVILGQFPSLQIHPILTSSVLIHPISFVEHLAMSPCIFFSFIQMAFAYRSFCFPLHPNNYSTAKKQSKPISKALLKSWVGKGSVSHACYSWFEFLKTQIDQDQIKHQDQDQSLMHLH